LMRGDLTLRLSNATTDDKFKHFLVTSNNEPVEWAKLQFHDVSDFQTRFKREIDSYENYYENLSRLYDDPLEGFTVVLTNEMSHETFDTLYDTYPTTALMVGFARCNIDRLRIEFDDKLGTLEGQQEIGNFILDLDHFRTNTESDDIAWGRASNAFQYIWNQYGEYLGTFNSEYMTYDTLLTGTQYIVNPSVTTTNYPVGKTIMSAPMTYRMIVGNILEHQESYSDVTYVPKTDIHESSTHLPGDNQSRFSSIEAITNLAKVQHIAQFVESVSLTGYTLSDGISHYETKRGGFSRDLDLIYGIPTGMYTFGMIEDYSVNQVLRKYVYFDDVDEYDNVFNANDFKTTCDAMDLNQSTKLINWGTLSNILLDYDTSLTTTNTKQLINKGLLRRYLTDEYGEYVKHKFVRSTSSTGYGPNEYPSYNDVVSTANFTTDAWYINDNSHAYKDYLVSYQNLYDYIEKYHLIPLSTDDTIPINIDANNTELCRRIPRMETLSNYLFQQNFLSGFQGRVTEDFINFNAERTEINFVSPTYLDTLFGTTVPSPDNNFTYSASGSKTVVGYRVNMFDMYTLNTYNYPNEKRSLLITNDALEQFLFDNRPSENNYYQIMRNKDGDTISKSAFDDTEFGNQITGGTDGGPLLRGSASDPFKIKRGFGLGGFVVNTPKQWLDYYYERKEVYALYDSVMVPHRVPSMLEMENFTEFKLRTYTINEPSTMDGIVDATNNVLLFEYEDPWEAIPIETRTTQPATIEAVKNYITYFTATNNSNLYSEVDIGRSGMVKKIELGMSLLDGSDPNVDILMRKNARVQDLFDVFRYNAFAQYFGILNMENQTYDHNWVNTILDSSTDDPYYIPLTVGTFSDYLYGHAFDESEMTNRSMSRFLYSNITEVTGADKKWKSYTNYDAGGVGFDDKEGLVPSRTVVADIVNNLYNDIHDKFLAFGDDEYANNITNLLENQLYLNDYNNNTLFENIKETLFDESQFTGNSERQIATFEVVRSAAQHLFDTKIYARLKSVLGTDYDLYTKIVPNNKTTYDIVTSYDLLKYIKNITDVSYVPENAVRPAITQNTIFRTDTSYNEKIMSMRSSAYFMEKYVDEILVNAAYLSRSALDSILASEYPINEYNGLVGSQSQTISYDSLYSGRSLGTGTARSGENNIIDDFVYSETDYDNFFTALDTTETYIESSETVYASILSSKLLFEVITNSKSLMNTGSIYRMINDFHEIKRISTTNFRDLVTNKFYSDRVLINSSKIDSDRSFITVGNNQGDALNYKEESLFEVNKDGSTMVNGDLLLGNKKWKLSFDDDALRISKYDPAQERFVEKHIFT